MCTASFGQPSLVLSLDGTGYEIDLDADHAKTLRDALAPKVSAVNRAGGHTRPDPRRRCSGFVV